MAKLCTFYEITHHFCKDMTDLMDVTGQEFSELEEICRRKLCIWHLEVRKAKKNAKEAR